MSQAKVLLAIPVIAAGLLFTGNMQAGSARQSSKAQTSKSKASGNASNQAMKGNANEGATLYKRQCAMCHGADLTGNTAMGKKFSLKSLKAPNVQNLTDAQLFDIIAKGKGRMPAYENNLGHDKIHDVVAYLREEGKEGKK